MKLKLENIKAIVVGAVTPVTAFDSAVQKVNADNKPVWRVAVVFENEDRQEITNVNIGSTIAPSVKAGDSVSFVNLQLQPWEMNGKKGNSFSATGVTASK